MTEQIRKHLEETATGLVERPGQFPRDGAVALALVSIALELDEQTQVARRLARIAEAAVRES
jgi:hypothetical protein